MPTHWFFTSQNDRNDESVKEGCPGRVVRGRERDRAGADPSRYIPETFARDIVWHRLFPAEVAQSKSRDDTLASGQSRVMAQLSSAIYALELRPRSPSPPMRDFLQAKYANTIG